ncbi:MAG TPA: glutamate-cysteine ligase family protein, partial [Methanomicrobiales archaeon]|nr:glutamate-cysteine ligase family protein [Methanomicrobiales archaeon]
SPLVEGRLTGCVDNRIHFYRINQQKIPSICQDLIPEKITRVEDYEGIQQEIYRELLQENAAVLCREWVNARGVIVRFSRRCLEIKAIDEQECIHSDMAVIAFVLSLLRNRDLHLEGNEQMLRELTETAMRDGTEKLRPELRDLYDAAWKSATDEEKEYLPLIEMRIEKGSIGEVMARRVRRTGDIYALLHDAGECLKLNHPLLEREEG